MFKKLVEEKIYVKVFRNRFEIIAVSGYLVVKSAVSLEAFSTSRLLIGNFSLAEQLLRNGIKEVLPKKLIKRSAAVLIHPIEMVDGGLCEVEVKILHEIAIAAGAHRVKLWEGEELTPQQATVKLENA